MRHCTQTFTFVLYEPSDPNVVYLPGDQFRLSRNEDRFVFGYVTRVGVQPWRGEEYTSFQTWNTNNLGRWGALKCCCAFIEIPQIYLV